MIGWMLLLLLCWPALVGAQSWVGIIDPTRALDWSAAGVVGGVPSETWTQCGATLAASSTAAQINSAITACGTNQYVQLGVGSFTVDAGLVLKSNMVLRGAGASQTLLNFTGNAACAGAFAAICIGAGDSSDYFGNAKMQPGGSNAATWTAGYAKGVTQITLTSIGSNTIAVGKYIHLDQASDTVTNSGFFSCESTASSPPCSAEGGQNDPGRVVGGIARQQVQIVKVTACSPSCTSGSTFTITPGLYAPNWASGKSPGAWWPSSHITNAGLEDLSLDSTAGADNKNVELYNADNIWIVRSRLIRSCVCNRSMIQMHAATHVTIQDNYFYGTTGQSQNYGVESYIAADVLVVNNIFQHVVTPMMVHANQGSVYAYNFAINDSYDDGGIPQFHYMANAWAGHSGGVLLNLIEGNVGPGLGADAIHGNQTLNTAFRNYWKGTDPGRIDATHAVLFESWSRYWNLLGNVFGTEGYHTGYITGGVKAVLSLGVGRSAVPDDSLTAATLMRWGNYDVVTAAVRWCGNSNNTGWSTTCASLSEVPTAVPDFPNPVPATETMPASLYYSARPGWWPASKAWPPIGPDVTGGNVAGYGGHINTIPAQDCYTTLMGGPADGTGAVLTFSPTTCYVTLSGTPPAAPSDLSVSQP